MIALRVLDIGLFVASKYQNTVSLEKKNSACFYFKKKIYSPPLGHEKPVALPLTSLRTNRPINILGTVVAPQTSDDEFTSPPKISSCNFFRCCTTTTRVHKRVRICVVTANIFLQKNTVNGDFGNYRCV